MGRKTVVVVMLLSYMATRTAKKSMQNHNLHKIETDNESLLLSQYSLTHLNDGAQKNIVFGPA